MEDVAALLDLLNTADGADWRYAYDMLLDAGYSWKYSVVDDCYRLNDLTAYFGF